MQEVIYAKKCKFTFQAKGDVKKTVTLDTEIEEQDHKVVCRLKNSKAEDNKKYDIKLRVEAKFKSNVEWTDKNGNKVKTLEAKVDWFIWARWWQKDNQAFDLQERRPATGSGNDNANTTHIE